MFPFWQAVSIDSLRLAETPRPLVPHKLAVKWHPFQSKPDRSQLALNSQTTFNNLHLLCWETIYTFLGTNNSVIRHMQVKKVKRYNQMDFFYSIQSSVVTVKASEYASGRKLIGSWLLTKAVWCAHSIQLSDYFLSLPVKSQFVLTILCHADSFSYASHYRLYAMSWLFVQCSDLRIVLFFPNPRGVYPIAVYTGRLCLKEVPFSGYKVYKRVGISRVEVYESARKSTILVCKRTKRANRRI